MKKYLVTGGSGFLGKVLIRRLLDSRLEEVRVVGRNESQLLEVKKYFPQVEVLTGDISDPWICKQAMRDVCGVYHLAGFKHVGWAEKQPWECIESNINGTVEILSAATLHKVDFVIGISTDKAAQVSGVYGASKFLMEAMFRHFESFEKDVTFRIVRYGNVMYSSGSVLSKWKHSIQHNEVLNITDPTATRFFWTVEQAVDLIFECLKNATSSAPYTPTMKSIRMGELLDCMIEKYGDGVRRVKEIGLQPGDNLHETMDGINFSNQCVQYTRKEILEMI